MKVRIDDDNCRGHGICCTLSPDVFDISDDGYAVALVAEVPAASEQAVATAAARCPERAIILS
ncbi:ferredoxin [Actinocorallia sp. A-T 12471]|uniref:ferredoxin n=1 Tax=Actinocorallia sp. A-T 12471 TaxID=3089813 RepID=UPI0029CE6A52|nr:ferredoxin [Actinocorallia sp. A-T 12471]MDX6740759.1 ferredoxin [Actinocorallia sp. A-T 12471]